ncbi:NAD(P)-dependent oxidoreductase [Streptomyces sp. XD-27]|uniref:NAD(P)-dependent oxidoreductase n=1 Tax=Streptomyces sp. XD-27 TaxID=3062779 RepID=UPI0026F474EC|nr:NAD(P)-binding domain-containing protein [Streptomyces sp. XD-27]WKX72554.1 NAD(P)-binding domain-containing protein [Streptomyces sp. XD-27]
MTAHPARPTTVSVLGLGSMGRALAGALLRGGHSVTVWNRSAGRADALVAQGARQAADAAEAVAAGELVIVCVLDYAAMHEILDPLGDALAGKVLVNLTSGSPELARETADWATGLGAAYLDGAIMITPPGVGKPESMFFYGGPRTAFDAHRATLSALGDPLYLGADAGLSSLYDTALLGLMWSALSGWVQGAGLLAADEVAAEAFTPVAVRWLTAVAGFITTYAPQVDAGSYPGDDATLEVHRAAIEHFVHASEAAGLDTALPRLLKGQIEQAIDAGHGADSYAAVIRVLAKGSK